MLNFCTLTYIEINSTIIIGNLKQIVIQIKEETAVHKICGFFLNFDNQLNLDFDIGIV